MESKCSLQQIVRISPAYLMGKHGGVSGSLLGQGLQQDVTRTDDSQRRSSARLPRRRPPTLPLRRQLCQGGAVYTGASSTGSSHQYFLHPAQLRMDCNIYSALFPQEHFLGMYLAASLAL